MDVTATMALKLVPKSLEVQPVFLYVDDTMVPKFGKKFEDASKLFDHATHNGSGYLNGHYFVNLMLCVPVWEKGSIVCRSVPLSYRMWQKRESKPEFAVSMVRQVMSELMEKKNVIILCDSWYIKSTLVSVVDEYPNLDLIGNVRCDSVLYDLAPRPTGRRGRPTKHGRCLSMEEYFILSEEKIGS